MDATKSKVNGNFFVFSGLLAIALGLVFLTFTSTRSAVIVMCGGGLMILIGVVIRVLGGRDR